MPRADGRERNQLRPVEIITGYQRYAEGSALIKTGDTWVLCAASVEEEVPEFLEGKGVGWVTAEYSMLPRSTFTRTRRDPGGRGKEIQRLIGRALRCAIDTRGLGERTIHIDCDVLQADGGTRVAAITGAWVALALAVRKLAAAGLVADPQRALRDQVAAVSVGKVGGDLCLDLGYTEDSGAEVDMNVVMTAGGQLVEVQGTAEKRPFGRSELDELLDLASAGIAELCAAQRRAVGLP